MFHSKSRNKDSTLSVLGAIGIGAALMYYFDPQAGRRRRALLRDQWDHTTRKFHEGQRVVMRDATNRAHGYLAQAQRLKNRAETADDVIVVERVRAALGREVSHPHAIEVHVNDGKVTLGGPILAHEVDNLVSCVKGVRGVKGVENNLSVFDDPGNIPSLQGGVQREGNRPEFFQSNWSPSARTAAGGFGALLAVFGFMRGGLGGLALGTLGSGLLARAATNRDVKSIVGLGPSCEGVRVQKAIHIDAPVERVFEAWANFENFPQWMSHVRWVRDEGNNRYHWLVDGPAGMPVEWHSELHDVIENRQMCWRSLEGSMVDQAGRVLFEEDPNGGTRVQVELCYVPIAGAIGHAVAKAFGADPKSEMDADLMRFKTRIETGNPPHDSAARRSALGSDSPPPGIQRH
jgi:uncharacterized membrane protein